MQIEISYASPTAPHLIASFQFLFRISRFYAFLMLSPECSFHPLIVHDTSIRYPFKLYFPFGFLSHSVHSHSGFGLCIHRAIAPRSPSRQQKPWRLAWRFGSFTIHIAFALLTIFLDCTLMRIISPNARKYSFYLPFNSPAHKICLCNMHSHDCIIFFLAGRPAGTSLPIWIVGCQVHCALETKTNLFKNFYVFKFISE